MAVPFGCTQEGIQIAGVPSSMYTIDLVTGLQTLVGAVTPSGTYNAIGYNTIDNYIYGWQYDNLELSEYLRMQQQIFYQRFLTYQMPNIMLVM